MAKQKAAVSPKPMSKEAAKAELHRRMMVLNESAAQILAARESLAGNSPDPRRNLDTECGYPQTLTPKNYRDMYEREGIATRVVNIYPDECWAVDPIIYENERKKNTPFEEKWIALTESTSNNPLHYCHRGDILSGIGEYGSLLLGINDGRDMSEPLKGVSEKGTPEGTQPERELLYIRAFDQSQCVISLMEGNDKKARFGHPLMYRMTFLDMAVSTGDVLKPVTRDVHWSRVIHLADNRESSEVRAAPRLRPVYNKVADTHKILGASAEMLYKGGFPGISIELDPRVLEAMNIEIDEDSISDEMFKYMNGLQRYLLLIGMNAKPLAPQVADPMNHLIGQLNSIAMTLGVPLRIFMGSEQAQLASGQDVRTWNRRIRRRQVRYLDPMVLRPLVDRFAMCGVLPQPKKGTYKTFWPDVNMPDEDQQSQIADRRADAMMKYIMVGGHELMQPSDFFRFVWGLTQEEIAEVMANIIQKAPEIKFTPKIQPKAPGDSGVKGNPLSKSKKGGKV